MTTMQYDKQYESVGNGCGCMGGCFGATPGGSFRGWPQTPRPAAPQPNGSDKGFEMFADALRTLSSVLPSIVAMKQQRRDQLNQESANLSFIAASARVAEALRWAAKTGPGDHGTLIEDSLIDYEAAAADLYGLNVDAVEPAPSAPSDVGAVVTPPRDEEPKRVPMAPSVSLDPLPRPPGRF